MICDNIYRGAGGLICVRLGVDGRVSVPRVVHVRFVWVGASEIGHVFGIPLVMTNQKNARACAQDYLSLSSPMGGDR